MQPHMHGFREILFARDIKIIMKYHLQDIMRKRDVKEQSVYAHFSKDKVVFFATRNLHKFNEARYVLADFKIATAMLRVGAIELQDDNIENIAKTSVIDASNKTNLSLIVEDAGLFIEALNGFPGPYSSYVYQTLGTKGVLQLMERVEKRDASFRSVIAFCNPKENPRTFHGMVRGKISLHERGSQGFGFDPVFEPLTSDSHKTFAEMSIREKNKFSHRALALREFAKWYISRWERRS